jgi:hypothetical protein
MFERNQTGLSARVDPWLLLSRGIEQQFQTSGAIVGQITDEVTQRGIWRHWKKVMSQEAKPIRRRSNHGDGVHAVR